MEVFQRKHQRDPSSPAGADNRCFFFFLEEHEPGTGRMAAM